MIKIQELEAKEPSYSPRNPDNRVNQRNTLFLGCLFGPAKKGGAALLSAMWNRGGSGASSWRVGGLPLGKGTIDRDE
jgi:hypothetical protein